MGNDATRGRVIVARKNKGPVTRIDASSYSLNIDASDRTTLNALLDQLRDVLMNDSSSEIARRLFPAAYHQDEQHEQEYQRLMRDELVTSRLHSIQQVEEFLADDSVGLLTFAQLDAFSASLNSVRLVLGTLLGVGEADEDLDDEDPRTDELALYNFLSWLLENAIQALMDSSV